jgi:hypothetical protein
MVMCDDGGGRRIIEGERDMTFKAFSFWRGQVSSSFPPEASKVRKGTHGGGHSDDSDSDA